MIDNISLLIMRMIIFLLYNSIILYKNKEAIDHSQHLFLLLPFTISLEVSKLRVVLT